MAKSLFKTHQINKVNSPEQLNDYIKTATPSSWLIVAAAIILLTSVLIWATFGSLNTTVTVKGIADGAKVVCYSENTSNIKVGDAVKVGSNDGKVVSVSAKPISYAQAQETIDADEYTMYCLALGEWNYVIEIELQNANAEGFVNAVVVTESTNPISFILN